MVEKCDCALQLSKKRYFKCPDIILINLLCTKFELCDGPEVFGWPVCRCFLCVSLPVRYLRGGAYQSGAPEAMASKAIKEGRPIWLSLSPCRQP